MDQEGNEPPGCDSDGESDMFVDASSDSPPQSPVTFMTDDEYQNNSSPADRGELDLHRYPEPPGDQDKSISSLSAQNSLWKNQGTKSGGEAALHRYPEQTQSRFGTSHVGDHDVDMTSPAQNISQKNQVHVSSAETTLVHSYSEQTQSRFGTSHVGDHDADMTSSAQNISQKNQVHVSSGEAALYRYPEQTQSRFGTSNVGDHDVDMTSSAQNISQKNQVHVSSGETITVHSYSEQTQSRFRTSRVGDHDVEMTSSAQNISQKNQGTKSSSETTLHRYSEQTQSRFGTSHLSDQVKDNSSVSTEDIPQKNQVEMCSNEAALYRNPEQKQSRFGTLPPVDQDKNNSSVPPQNSPQKNHDQLFIQMPQISQQFDKYQVPEIFVGQKTKYQVPEIFVGQKTKYQVPEIFVGQKTPVHTSFSLGSQPLSPVNDAQGQDNRQHQGTGKYSASPTHLTSPQKLDEKTMQNPVQPSMEDEEKTVKVTGESLKSDDEELCKYYFENTKRSGGGETSCVMWDDERKCFFITFLENAVAERVIWREQSLNNCQIQVELCQPPPLPRNRGAQPSSTTSERHSLPPTTACQKITVTATAACQKITAAPTAACQKITAAPTAACHKAVVTPTDACDEDAVTPADACHKDAVTSADACHKDAVTSADACHKDAVTSADACHKDAVTSADACHKDAVTSADACHTDRFTIFGVPESTTHDCLRDYLEVATDVFVECLTMEGDHWLAVLDSSDEEIDIQKMNRLCRETPLAPDIELTIKGIPKQSTKLTIYVSGLKPTTADETIKFFFSNKRRNNGGPVKKVERLPDKSKALVHFEKHEDAENVVEKGGFTLENIKLHVTLYHGTDMEERHGTAKSASLQENMHTGPASPKREMEKELGAETCNRILQSFELLNTLKMDLKSVDARPQLKTDHVIVSCLLEVPTRDWEKSVHETIDRFLRRLPPVTPPEGIPSVQEHPYPKSVPPNREVERKLGAEICKRILQSFGLLNTLMMDLKSVGAKPQLKTDRIIVSCLQEVPTRDWEKSVHETIDRFLRKLPQKTPPKGIPPRQEHPNPKHAPPKREVERMLGAETCKRILQNSELLNTLMMDLKSVNAMPQFKTDHIIVSCLQEVPTRYWEKDVHETFDRFLRRLPPLTPPERIPSVQEHPYPKSVPPNREVERKLGAEICKRILQSFGLLNTLIMDLKSVGAKPQLKTDCIIVSCLQEVPTRDWEKDVHETIDRFLRRLPPVTPPGMTEHSSQSESMMEASPQCYRPNGKARHSADPVEQSETGYDRNGQESKLTFLPPSSRGSSAGDRNFESSSSNNTTTQQNEKSWKNEFDLELKTQDTASATAYSDTKMVQTPVRINEDTISNLKPCQQRVLSNPAVMKHLCVDFEGLQIFVDEEQRIVKLRAPEGIFLRAKNRVLTFMTNVRERCIQLTPVQVKMYQQEDVVKWIQETVIDKHGFLVHWQVLDGNIILSGLSSDLSTIDDVIKRIFTEKRIPLEESQLCLLKSRSWLSFLDGLQGGVGNPKPVLLHEGNDVIIMDTPSNISATQLKLIRFFDKNKQEEKTLDIKQQCLKFLKEYCKDSLTNILKKAKENGVTIIFTRSSMVAKGPKDCLPETVQEMKELLGKIQQDKMNFKKPGTAKYLRSPKGQEFLMQVGTATRCLVTTDDGGFDHGASSDQWGGSNVIANVQLDPEHQLQIIQGDITKCPVDAIVNAANKHLEHDGGVAYAIVKAGGQSIQKESEELIKKYGNLNTGEVAVTRAGILPCSHVIHAVGPIWSSFFKDKNERLLMETVRNVLKKAQDMNLTSVALPAISCGIFGFPITEATGIILNTIDKFFRDEGNQSTLKKLVLIALNAEPISGFLSAAKALYGKSVEMKNSPKSARGWQSNPQQQETQAGGSRETRRPPSDHSYSEKSHTPLKIIPGEIAKSKADVIVCTIHPSLDLQKGVLSKSILREGGEAIQKELADYRERFSTPAPGHVVRTSGGRLQCKTILHFSLPRWHEDRGEAMKAAVAECLKEASKKRAKSIAFPTLGTGRLGYPSDQVAAIMSSAIGEWFDKHHDTSLKEVQVIVFPKDTETLQAFNAGERQGGDKSGGRGNHQFRGRRDDANSAGGLKKCKVKIGNITVMVKEGDILSEPCDAIVNSSNNSLDLSKGVLSKAISKAGGSQLEEECKKKRDHMKDKGVAVTRVEGLVCGSVIHVSADRFKSEWQKGILEVLRAADKEDISSLAMPALGTGGRGADPEELAHAMCAAVTQFSRNARVLKEVQVVVFQKQLMRPYISAFDGSASSHSDKAERSGSGAEAPVLSAKKDVDVFICSVEKSAIKTAREKIHKHVTDMMMSKTEKSSLISSFTSEQKEKVFRLQNKFDVEIMLDASKGAATFTGIETHVLEAVSALKDIMMSATRERHKAAGGPPVRWQYETGSNKFADFDPDTTLTIEAAFKKKERYVNITDRKGRRYKIVFHEKKEYCLDDPRAKPVAVNRRDILQEKSQEFPLPPHWAPMKGDEVKLVSLKPDSDEYKRVAELFGKQGGIKGIERVQNPTLYHQYKVKKRDLELNNPKGTENEKRLFHGTTADSISGIASNGFNRSYCGVNGTALGAGVYFAANSATSVGYTKGGGKMFQARVLVGEYVPGNSGMKTAPMKPNSKRPYDSVSNAASNGSVFVIFHDCQAYPEYVISF